jgi:pimeloyl-ACP methyl ester carboxylesterase
MKSRGIPFVLALAMLPALPVWAATCDKEDDLHVSGVSQCLIMRKFGSETPDLLVVWLHGDVSSGGPANYHFAAAERAASDPDHKMLSIALVRPGYPDGSGNESSVSFTNRGRSDHYTRDNVSEVGAAIERLRDRYKPKTVLVVGHSGGAATTAILLGMKPSLINDAVLVSCPCDTVAWRAGRRPWSRSENPMSWTTKVDPRVKVIALTGDKDDNTLPALAQEYVGALTARGVQASFRLLPGETHDSAFRSEQVREAIHELVSGE